LLGQIRHTAAYTFIKAFDFGLEENGKLNLEVDHHRALSLKIIICQEIVKILNVILCAHEMQDTPGRNALN
jgi:hypothetical protein